MNALRKVIVSGNVPVPVSDGRVQYQIKPIGEALFHTFGLEAELGIDSMKTCSVAIVEFPDGKVRMVHPTMIQFVNPPAIEKEVD